MGTFNNALWNSGTWGGTLGSGGGGVATNLAGLLTPALRIAGITKRPGIMAGVDQFTELIPAMNRMLASWSVDGHKIFTTSIATYSLVASQKIHTIGPGADFDAPRPLYIKSANILFPTSPVVRRPISIVDDDQWRTIRVQDIPGAPPTTLYYDSGLDDNGWASIYLKPQAPAGYSLELYTWQALKADFSDVNDAVILPPGYEDAIVYNFALKTASLYPHECKVDPIAHAEAQKTLQALMTLNSNCPVHRSEAAFVNRAGGGLYNYTSGQRE
mgnify:CR=1 FL=1